MPALNLADFERDALDTLTTYAAIPCLSPMYDADWIRHGYIDQAIELLSDWAIARTIADFDVEIRRLGDRTPVLVVASGVKSILDIGATLERLDSLGVPVVGYRTERFPGFYLTDSGFALEWSVDGPDAAAAAFLAHREFSGSGMLLANAVAPDRQLDPAVHQRALDAAFEKARELGVSGKEVTPVLLAEFARVTAGESVRVNRDLVVANAALAGAIATARAQRRG